MTRVSTMLRRFAHDEEGAALVEYGLLVVLIALVAIVAVKLTGSKVNSVFDNAQNALP